VVSIASPFCLETLGDYAMEASFLQFQRSQLRLLVLSWENLKGKSEKE